MKSVNMLLLPDDDAHGNVGDDNEDDDKDENALVDLLCMVHAGVLVVALMTDDLGYFEFVAVAGQDRILP